MKLVRVRLVVMSCTSAIPADAAAVLVVNPTPTPPDLLASEQSSRCWGFGLVGVVPAFRGEPGKLCSRAPRTVHGPDLADARDRFRLD